MNVSRSIAVGLPCFLLLFVDATLAPIARANERIRPRAQLLREGYLPVSYPKQPTTKLSYGNLPASPGSLNWPVDFADASHTLGNNMLQFQNYGSEPYYHGGCDLRTKDGAEVRAPVAGHLEAGHYSYDTNSDGSLRKYFRAWPKTGPALSFEVAIITDEGFRFEFHHIDRDTLPTEIVQMLDRGGGRVVEGQIIGHVITWPVEGVDGELYHHTHYNIVAPNGIRYNPEYYSRMLIDQKAPALHGVYALDANGRGIALHNDERIPQPIPREFVVATTDQRASNVYTQAPLYVALKFSRGDEVVWDFRHRLLNPTDQFAAIWDVFKESLAIGGGRVLRTQGDYNNNFFLYRLKTPASAGGDLTFTVQDASGNATVFRLRES